MVQVAHWYITLMAKGKESTGHARPRYMAGQGPDISMVDKATDIPDMATVGRQDPQSYRQAETLTQWQRPSPTRAPTRTSRRVGIGQGDLPHTREATSASRMHGNHKEQYGSHSLNRWKERFALQHRHAGMSTGSEPYTLRGILDKGAWALMTRLGPSHERGPRTQPHKIVSEFSVCIYYTVHSINDNGTMCSIEKTMDKPMGTVAQYYIQCSVYNVFNWEEDNLWSGQCAQYYHTMCSIKESVPIDRAVAQYYLCI